MSARRGPPANPEQEKRGSSTGERLCLRGGTVLTCDAEHRVLRADVLIEDGRITRLGAVPRSPRTRELSVQGRVVLPGLVMAHVHLCQAIMRGMASDLPLLAWLRERIWPLEAAHDARSLTASAELGLTELLLAGTTTVLDLGTVHGYEVVQDACARVGLRVIGGKVLMDSGAAVPRRLRERTGEALKSAERLAAGLQALRSSRLAYAWIPRFVLSSSEALIRGAVERARARGELVHTHAAEHAGECAAVRREFGTSDVRLLRRWGLFGPRASIAHGVQLSPAEMKALARDATRVVHCPSANLKLGSGIANVAGMRAAGLIVGLGADGAPCNDNLDPWMELRHAALLACVRSAPGALPAREALRMATMDGARLLGLDDSIGSVEAGKRADLVVVRLDRVHTSPALDPVTALVFSAQARDVEHVLVDGELLVRAGELTKLDADRIAASARVEALRLRRRAGLG